MPKTPFELRFEALQEATSILTQEYYAKYEVAKELYKSSSPSKFQQKLGEIIFPSPQTIIELAQTYDRFVANKSL